MRISRRHFIVGAGTAAATTAAGWALWRRSAEPGEELTHAQLPPDPQFPNRLLVPGTEDLHGIYEVGGAFTLVSGPVLREILPDKPATMLGYTVERGGRALLNPLLRVQAGAHLRVRYWNALDETSIVHWHGLKVDTNNDGHPHYAVGAGETYDYHFTVTNRAGTYWYHPHPHHLAAKQAYLGLAGVLVVEDAEELALQRALDLTLGVTDVPLLIQDKRFDEDGTLRYAPGAQDQFYGYFGDSMLVNLTPSPCFDCASRLYRFRFVNGSNARIYRLAFMRGTQALDFHVIGADGGLLERPVAANELFLSPSERADVVLDLRSAALGERVMLSSLPFDPLQFSGHARGHQAQTADIPANGAPLDLMLIRVTSKLHYEKSLPGVLSRIEPLATESARQRRFVFDHAKGMWRINGYSYRMTDTAFSVKRGTTEVWDFRNATSAMPHPIHVHGFQVRVLERRGSPEHLTRLAVNERGLQPTELGWKDTVLLWPGETLKLAIDFSHPFPGDQVYMLQCHNLEHETHGMMVNFLVAQ